MIVFFLTEWHLIKFKHHQLLKKLLNLYLPYLLLLNTLVSFWVFNFVLSCYYCLTNQQLFSMVCALINNNNCHHSSQNVVDLWDAAQWFSKKFWLLWWQVSLLIRIQTMLDCFWFVFIPLTISMSNKTVFLVGEMIKNNDKGIVWCVDASSVVCTLIDNSKLVGKIMTLLPIVVKSCNIWSISDWFSNVWGKVKLHFEVKINLSTSTQKY